MDQPRYGILGVPAGRPISDRETEGAAQGRSIRVDARWLKGSLSSLEEMFRQPGLIVRGADEPESAAVVEWRAEKRIERDGEVFFVGPDFSGVDIEAPLRSAVGEARLLSDEEARAFLKNLAAAARALDILAKAGRAPAAFFPSTTIASPSGEVLFLPAGLAELGGAKAYGGAHLGPEPSMLEFARRAALLFPDSLLADIPFGRRDRDTDKSASLAFLSLSALPMEICSPGTGRELAALLREKNAAPSAKNLAEAIGLSLAAHRAATEPKPESGSEPRMKAYARARRAAGMKYIFTHYKLPFIVGIVCLGLVGWIAYQPISSSARSARIVQALAPEALVRAYYAAIDSLDSDFISYAGRKSAVSDDDSLTTNLTVMSRYRYSIERREVLVKASAWLAAGQPPLEEGALLFGITDLEIKPVEASPLSFVSEYRLWTMEAQELGMPIPVVSRVRDELVLQTWGKGYRIKTLTRSETPGN
jgi:hypothetical protein